MSQSEESFVDLITRLSMNQRLFVVRQEKERVTLEVQRKDEGRKQTVWAVDGGPDPHGHLMLTLVSPAEVYDRGTRLTSNVANRLLRDNGDIHIANWAIYAGGSQDFLAAMVHCVKEYLTPEIFGATVRNVAHMADEMEKRFGQDAF